MNQYKRIGEAMLSQGIITEEQLQLALERRMESHKRLGEVLVDMGFVSEGQVVECLSEQYGYEIADLDRVIIEPSALSILDCTYAFVHLVLPFRDGEDSMECIMADPMAIEVTDHLSALTHKRLIVHLAPPSELASLIWEAYAINDAPANGPVRSVVILEGGDRAKPRADRYADRKAIISAIQSHASAARGSIFSRLSDGMGTDRKAA